MGAYASADTGHWIGPARDAVGFFELTLRNQLNISARIGVRGAGHHAGKVGVQPVSVNLLVNEALLHAGLFLFRENRGSKSILAGPV
jgi:hypothetical protein